MSTPVSKILYWLNRFYNSFKQLTVIDALDIICDPLQSDKIKYRTGINIYPVTELYCDITIYYLPASQFIFEWYGGPPFHMKWQKASMLALLVDCCLFAMLTDKTSMLCNAIGMAEKYDSSRLN